MSCHYSTISYHRQIPFQAEELATLLTKRGWHETAHILQENEIDGEALFLVSNAQLLDIGVNESHALVLSSLVKK